MSHVTRLITNHNTSPIDAIVEANTKYNIEEIVAASWVKNHRVLFTLVEIEAEKTHIIPKTPRLDI